MAILNRHKPKPFLRKSSFRFRMAWCSYCLLLWIILSLIVSIVAESPVCKQFCINGNCDQNDQCKCHPCWKGLRCDQYDDPSKALFEEKTVKLYLKNEKLSTNKPIYIAKAFDQDSIQCKNAKNCSCSLVHYKLDANQPKHPQFRIDAKSGEIFVTDLERILPETEYKLEVIAFNPITEHFADDIDESGQHRSRLTILLKVQNDLSRVKREAVDDDELNGMTFGLRTLAGDANALQVGSSIHYKLEVSFPKGLSKLLLEIKTYDTPFTVNRTSLSLYNFSMPYESENLEFKIPEAKFVLSNKTINVYDRLVLDFGTVKNTGPTGNIMTVCFSTILYRKPKKAKKKHQLHVGIQNQEGGITVVAESEITTASLSYKDDQIFTEVKMVDSPERMTLDSAAIFRFDANLQFRSDPVKIQLNKTSFEYEPDNIVSLGLISVTRLGENWKAIPQEPRYYAGYRNKTFSKIAYGTSMLDMNTITNNGPKSRTFNRDPNNIITYSFTVYAMDFKENIGRNVSFTMDLFVGKKSFFTRTFNMTIEKRNDHERIQTLLLRSSGNFTNQNVTKGGVTQLKIKSEFDGFPEKNVFTDYSVVVDVSQTPILPFVPCAARLLNEESGLNLPFVNPTSIKPDKESNRFVFHFGRLNFVKLIDEFAPGDNDVGVELTLRIPFDSPNDDATGPISAKVNVVSGAKDEPVLIEDNAINVLLPEDNRTATIEMTTNSSVKWNELIVKGGVAIDIELDLPANTAYPDFIVSIAKGPPPPPSNVDLPDLNICRFSVVEVSDSIPCTCVERETINSEKIIYGNTPGKTADNDWKDQARIDFGSISVVNGSDGRQKIVSNFVAMIEKKPSGNERLYPIQIDVLSQDNTIISDVKYLNISQTIPNTIDEMWIDLEVELLEDKFIVPGFTTKILIKALTKPKTMGPFNIEVYSEDETIISICGLWVHRIGYNMPCVDPNKMANYDFINFGQNRRAILNYDMITNFGHHHRKSAEDEKDDNTIEFVSMIRAAETASGNQTLKIKINYGRLGEIIVKDMIIPVGKASLKHVKQLAKPRHVALKSMDGNEMVHGGVPKLFYFDIEMDNNSETSLAIAMDSSNYYKMCSAAIIKVGDNYPCYSPFELNIMPNKFELGIICNTYLHKKRIDDNRIRLAFALRPNDNVSPFTPFTVSGMVYVGQRPSDQKNEMTMSVIMDIGANNLNEFPILDGAAVEAESNDSIVLKIRQRKWIVFDVRIPVFSTGKLKTVIKGESENDRAILVLYDAKLIHGGQNIPCPFENKPVIELNSTVKTNQTNMIIVDWGWFSNFGYTYYLDPKNQTNKYGDDILKIKVLVELTDHPTITENDEYKLRFETHFGNTTYSVTNEAMAQIKPSLVDVSEPKLDVNIKYKKRMPLLDRNDTFTLMATIKHLPESSAEPSDPVLRMFTPNFVEITEINWANTKSPPVLKRINEGSTDIEFPWILFNEEFQVNFTVQIDPKNIRGYGRKEKAIINPFRMMCQHFRVNPNRKDQKFPCSIMKHINYRTESSECNVPLGMESGDILDEQLSASITVGREYSPQHARPKTKSFWSPSIRSWKVDHYLQIDFKRKTRLVRLVFQSIENMRRVDSYHVDFSNDGRVWFQGTNNTRVTYNEADGVTAADSYLEKPIETRLVRLVIDSVSSGNKDSKNRYIAVKVELYGCYLDVADSSSIIQHQSIEFRTHYTDDVRAKNRHISIDPATNVAYFCDSTTSENHYFCYYSDSGGNYWTIVGRSIDSFEGFEMPSGKFYAIDHDRPAYFYSTDGNNWTPIDQESFNMTAAQQKFQPKILIPRYIQDDVDKMDVHVGNWKANYNGLIYEDNPHPKALWSKCCGVE